MATWHVSLWWRRKAHWMVIAACFHHTTRCSTSIARRRKAWNSWIVWLHETGRRDDTSWADFMAILFSGLVSSRDSFDGLISFTYSSGFPHVVKSFTSDIVSIDDEDSGALQWEIYQLWLISCLAISMELELTHPVFPLYLILCYFLTGDISSDILPPDVWFNFDFRLAYDLYGRCSLLM